MNSYVDQLDGRSTNHGYDPIHPEMVTIQVSVQKQVVDDLKQVVAEHARNCQHPDCNYPHTFDAEVQAAMMIHLVSFQISKLQDQYGARVLSAAMHRGYVQSTGEDPDEEQGDQDEDQDDDAPKKPEHEPTLN